MEELGKMGIRAEILEGLAGLLEVTELTLIQQRCVGPMLAGKDVVAQAPTGSGKTLAYVLPTLERLLRHKAEWAKWKVGALVIVPSRELAFQVAEVAKACASKTSLRVLAATGGRRALKVAEEFREGGGNLIVGTPGRIQELLSSEDLKDFGFAGHFKALEILILDETDRLLELGLKEKLSVILHALPKQRRTGLFSATQVEEGGEELKLAGLRNPFRVTVSAEEQVEAQPTGTLRNFYLKLGAEWKVPVLGLLAKELWAESKVLVFLPTCACVEYLEMVLRPLLPSGTKLMGMHGKKRKQREKLFAAFREMKRGLMLCTDVMGRGIDVSDIDWVVQLGPPRQTAWFVHRAGRTARAGQPGSALILLAPSEDDYVDYLFSQTAVVLEPLDVALDLTDAAAKDASDKIRALALKDRAVLEKGTKAFVSFVQAYSKQDSKIVCPLEKLDAVGLLHSFGLLRVPKMRELCGRDLTAFRRCTTNTAEIRFKDKGREKRRKEKLVLRAKENDERKKKQAEREAKGEGKGKVRAKRPAPKDVEDIDDDYRLLRKLKKGRLSKKEFDKSFK